MNLFLWIVVLGCIGAMQPTSFAQSTNHWAWKPLSSPHVPAASSRHPESNPIDRFVRAQLAANSVHPNPQASARVLLRRGAYDLIGLPPDEEFLSKYSETASMPANEWVAYVDAMIANPGFGERWARHWLDLARYGESVTLRGLVFQHAWRYRNYIIDAFNYDLPFDQFIREQIAGDLLPSSSLKDRRSKIIATTFLTLGNTNLEEQDKVQLRMDVVDEQLDTIGKAILGQTLGCARCHDHKFDPIPTSDYYAMAGILRSTRFITNANVSGWIEVPLPHSQDEESRLESHEQTLNGIREQLVVLRAEKSKLGPTTLSSKGVVPPTQFQGIIVDSSQAKLVGEWKTSQFSKNYIGDGYLHDDASGKGEKTASFIPDLKTPGQYEVRIAYDPGSSRATNTPVTVFHADGETRLHLDQRFSPPIFGRFYSLGSFRFEGNGFGQVIVGNENTQGHVTADAVQFLHKDLGDSETKLISNSTSKTKIQSIDEEIQKLEKKLKAEISTGPKRDLAMGVEEADDTGDTYVHIRGSVHTLGQKVPRGFLNTAGTFHRLNISTNSSGRLELANWLSHPQNPLTARVYVNRVWHWLMGKGIVRTTDNFGSTGEPPSNPALLDYLASEFMKHNWSTKWLVRSIVLSETYKRSSARNHVPSQSKDPENRYFWRGERRRMEAETMRDYILAASGLLTHNTVTSLLPPDLNADYGYSNEQPVRSIYLPWLRNSIPDLFEVFDAADPSRVTGNRNDSIGAPQALFLMNDTWVKHQSQTVAKRWMSSESAGQRHRLSRMSKALLGREPLPGEVNAALKYLSRLDNSDGWDKIAQALIASADFRHID